MSIIDEKMKRVLCFGWIFFFVLWVPLSMGATGESPCGKDGCKVHVAFGFHVNLYHSFRGDTHDEDGFGKDIRIIRHVIRTLDAWNDRGVAVRAVWDFDNLFSLQEILPRHAPDIIADVRRRVRENGDEVILMSYNNGLASAMTPTELRDAVAWAVSNPWGSGVQDLFGTYSPIVRPQEMMTTPGTFAIYKAIGIQAVCLYYSATPFDTFRVFTRPLSPVEAHNPMVYEDPDSGETMTVIPTYNIGDLAENVSLRHWVEALHRLGERGELTRDVLVFINYDADSDFWVGGQVPWLLEWLPNTRGIDGLIAEIQDLPYVTFTSLGTYLENHRPVGTFHFGQDTADGSFVGYNAWAEKAQVSGQWTRIERSRRLETTARSFLPDIADVPSRKALETLIETAYLTRLRALSTTHFGMATPFVVSPREMELDRLLLDLDRLEGRLLGEIGRSMATNATPVVTGITDTGGASHIQNREADRFLLVHPATLNRTGEPHFLNVELPVGVSPGTRYRLTDSSGGTNEAFAVGQCFPNAAGGVQMKLYFPSAPSLTDRVYRLEEILVVSRTMASHWEAMDTDTLKNGPIEVRFDTIGQVTAVKVHGVDQLMAGSLMPHIRYGDRLSHPPRLERSVWRDTSGRSASVRLRGIWPGEDIGAERPGDVDVTFTLITEMPVLFVSGNITYPQTPCDDWIKADAPLLARQADLRWREVAPMELRFSHRADPAKPVQVLKENLLGVRSRYVVDYFRHSDENRTLDNVNNHITAGYMGVVAGDHGMTVAMDRSVQANFAFAPLKILYDRLADRFMVRINPFGTYHGRQYRPPTWGTGEGYDLSLLLGEQFHSAAPTYNGRRVSFSIMIGFFDGDRIPVALQSVIGDFSDAAMLIPLEGVHPSGPAPLGPDSNFPMFTENRDTIQRPGTIAPERRPPEIPLNLKLKVTWSRIRAFMDRDLL